MVTELKPMILFMLEDVNANVLALRSSSTDQFYNVGSGIQTSIAKLCELILELKSSI